MAGRLLILISLLAALGRAAIIDRIAVTLDNQVITASEIDLEIRITAFLNGDALDFSPAARRKAADRLIEQKLIRREMQLGRYTPPSTAVIEPTLTEIQAQRFHSPEEYRLALTKYGISEGDMKAHLLWQVTLLRFIDVRFRPAIQVTDAEIQSYLDANRAKLEAQSGSARKPAVEELRREVRETLAEQRADKQLDEWLAEVRKGTRIVFREEAFQ